MNLPARTQKYLPADIEDGHRDSYWKASSGLCKYFGVEISADRISMAYSHLRHIPSVAFQFIAAEIQKDRDTLPRNLAKTFLEYYEQRWRPTNKLEREQQPCEHCLDSGFFTAIHPGIPDEYPFQTRYLYRCGGCANWRGMLGDRVPIAFPLEVRSRGLKIYLYDKKAVVQEISFDARKMAENVGVHLNPGEREMTQGDRNAKQESRIAEARSKAKPIRPTTNIKPNEGEDAASEESPF